MSRIVVQIINEDFPKINKFRINLEDFNTYYSNHHQ